MKFSEYMGAQQTVQPEQPAAPMAPKAMTQTMATYVDKLLDTLGAKNPTAIQEIIAYLNQRMLQLQSEKGRGDWSARQSWQQAAQARKEV